VIPNLEAEIVEAARAAKIRLRFDKVALGFVARLRTALRGRVPAGKTLVVTCTAPIRQDSKTGAALVEELQKRLARASSRLAYDDVVYDNRVSARLLASAPRAPKVLGFVHDAGSDEKLLARVAQTLMRR